MLTNVTLGTSGASGTSVSSVTSLRSNGISFRWGKTKNKSIFSSIKI